MSLKIKNTKKNRAILESIFSNPPKKENVGIFLNYSQPLLQIEQQIIDDLEENHYNAECICNNDNVTCLYSDMINLKITKKELLSNFGYDNNI